MTPSPQTNPKLFSKRHQQQVPPVALQPQTTHFTLGQEFVAQLNSIELGLRTMMNDPEMDLLHLPSGASTSQPNRLTLDHGTRHAPIFTGEAAEQLASQFPQRAVLGSIVSQHAQGFPETTLNPKLYMNINTPFSALICGVQGSGKSHSASVILEGCLVVDQRIGSLPKPLSALCLHYEGGNINHPCEAAYLSMPATKAQLGAKSFASVPVTVLVSPTCVETMKKVYGPLKNVNILPFFLATSHLNSGRMLSLMGFDNSLVMPLYLQRAMTILRQMGADKFHYESFKRQMAQEDLNPAQRSSFDMRIEMLNSYLIGKKNYDVTTYFKPGHLVIVDLRDPFTNSSLVVALFEIVVGLFVEHKMNTGKVLLLDEAHKYLKSDPASARFTDAMTSLIRQQRHFGIRTIISTQEPTIIPNTILDLVSVLVLHRFSSPSWIKHLAKHISVDQNEDLEANWSRMISKLALGEAVLVSPTALSVIRRETGLRLSETISTGYLVIRTRKRLTFDGGASVVACK